MSAICGVSLQPALADLLQPATDYDGDTFTIYLGERLYPKRVHPPGEYTPLVAEPLEHPCTMDDLSDFICRFIVSDQIGFISTLHLAIADFSPLGGHDPRCLKLAEMHSHAVNFRKTGVPVSYADLPTADSRLRPDFIVQTIETGFTCYRSPRALGQLYRDIPLIREDEGDILAASLRASVAPQSAEDIKPALSDNSDRDLLRLALNELAARFPHLKPSNEELVWLSRSWYPLMNSFSVQLFRIAGWCAERASGVNLLSEEEVLLAVIASKTVSKKRKWSDKLRQATQELGPFLRTQMRRAACHQGESVLIHGPQFPLGAQQPWRFTAIGTGTADDPIELKEEEDALVLERPKPSLGGAQLNRTSARPAHPGRTPSLSTQTKITMLRWESKVQKRREGTKTQTRRNWVERFAACGPRAMSPRPTLVKVRTPYL